MSDAVLAAEVARAAGELLLELRAGAGHGGPVGRELGKLGDVRSNRLILDRLAAERPDDVVLSEEAPDPRRRLSADRVWIVDPLDGTREYGEPGRDDWAVHVALWAHGELALGAVALPALGEVAVSSEPPPAPARPARPRIVVSRSRPPAFVAALAEDLGADLLPLGSAGAKAAAVWRGQAEAYVHTGGQYEWDSAAPVAVARAAGLHTSRVDGSPLEYNREDAYLPDLVVCTPELAEPILAWTERVLRKGNR